MLKEYQKFVSVEGKWFTLSTMKENSYYDKEFDRIDSIGMFNNDTIVKNLKDMGVSPYIEFKKDIPVTDLTFREIFYILDNMQTMDLVYLSGHIVNNDYVKTLVDKIVYIRNLKAKSKQSER